MAYPEAALSTLTLRFAALATSLLILWLSSFIHFQVLHKIFNDSNL